MKILRRHKRDFTIAMIIIAIAVLIRLVKYFYVLLVN